ncbi:MAG: 5-formyltetrahydrofolate cyclo-ligase [Candidatus Ornithospirochaeta sp.]
MDKAEMRKTILSSLRSFDGREDESKTIVGMILSHPKWASSKTILAFSPLSSEPDISPLLSDGRILLPYIAEDGSMEFGKGEMRRNKLGFMEPGASSPFPYEKALMLVPLVAVDNSGMRLGRGKGYYDRYIEKNREKLYTMGVALSPSVVESVPFGEGDMKLDEVIYVKVKSRR